MEVLKAGPGGVDPIPWIRKLTSEMFRSDTYAPGMFDRVGEWLKQQGLAR